MLTIQGWDKDIIASNDLIGEFTMDITPLVEDAIITKKQMNLSSKYWNEYFKDKIVESGFEFAEQIEWEDKTDFWVPIRRFD